MPENLAPVTGRCHNCGATGFFVRRCVCEQHGVCPDCDNVPCPRDVKPMDEHEFLDFILRSVEGDK